MATAHVAWFSVPRDRAERIIVGFTAAELPKLLSEIEARYESHRPVPADHRPRIAELERRIANFVKAIGDGLFSPEVDATLRAARAELAQLKAATPTQVRAQREAESIERRVARSRPVGGGRRDCAGDAARAVPERNLARARPREALPVGAGTDGVAR